MNDLSHIQQYLTEQYQMEQPGPSTSTNPLPCPSWPGTVPPTGNNSMPPPPAPGPGPIRRRRFSTAKIQPTRIKKVMQSDEEIGRMVASVPVAIGRAMEHFAEKFLQSAAMVTHRNNSRTLTPAHMKQAMLENRHFGFLENLLKEVGTPGLPKVEPEGGNEARMHLQLTDQFGAPTNGDLNSLTSPMYSTPLTPNGCFTGGFPTSLNSPTAALSHLSFQQMGTIQGLPLVPTLAPELAPTGPAKKTNGKKAPDTVDGEKPKRGRPRKIKKDEKCLDEELCKDAAKGIEKEDKDREMMPPPSLPFAMGPPKPVV